MEIAALLGLLPGHYATYGLATMGICAVTDALFPQPAPGSRWVPVRRVVSALGANFLNARNELRPDAAR